MICVYCSAEIDDSFVPRVGDDASWRALSCDHERYCDWIATRAHRVEAPGSLHFWLVGRQWLTDALDDLRTSWAYDVESYELAQLLRVFVDCREPGHIVTTPQTAIGLLWAVRQDPSVLSDLEAQIANASKRQIAAYCHGVAL